MHVPHTPPADPRRNAAARRAQLVSAAITVFSRVGFHRATVKEITSTAGMSAGLPYQYVQDKHDLLFLALQHIVEANRRELPSAIASSSEPLLRLARAIDAYTRVIALNRRAVLLTYRETKSLRQEDAEAIKRMELETNALIATCVEQCVRSGVLRPHHTELLVFRIIVAAHAWALKNWRLRSIVTLDQYIEQCIHACWYPLLTPRGRRRWQRLRSETAG